MVIGDFGNDQTIEIKKMQFINFPQCAGLSCEESNISKQIHENNFKYDMECPFEKPHNHFALKYREHHRLILRSCKWLGNKPDAMKKRICSNKRFQLYADGYMPASISCPETCSKNNRIEERQNAMFFAGYEDVQTGKDSPVIRRCKWLAKQEITSRIKFCHYPPKRLFGDKIKYGDAKDICPKTCENNSL